MAINWANLRVWSGSRDTAFEELCCQLAAQEPPAVGARFIRKGTPDAGVECYWELPGGDEHAWQAKFFEAPPTSNQWAQVDDSVETALDKHPRMTRYTVCMAVDRSDSRLAGHKTFLARWNERVAKWKKWATAKKRSVEFEFWGNHELASRLSGEVNRGRFWFWFNGEQLTQEWFARQLEVAIDNTGDRYTPVLHVELPLTKSFEALGRTPAFHARLGELYLSMREAFSRVTRGVFHAEITPVQDAVRKVTDGVFAVLDAILLPLEDEPQLASVRPIPWEDLKERLKTTIELTGSLSQRVQRLTSEHSKNAKPQSRSGHTDNRNLSDLSVYASDAYLAASRLDDFCGDGEAAVANRPELLLVGGAGQGKTHLLCDLAARDLAAGRLRLLFHGSHFKDGEPWTQIVSFLGLKCTPDEFLGALEAAGQACGCRVLILIDALNEGDGRRLWEKHLPGMLTRLARSPWLGIALSVRDSYEDLVIPKGLVPGRLTRVIHSGFQEHEYEAVHRFFTHFGIQPTGPLLVPEFANPLFLKLYCKTVKDMGHTQMPLGLRGITALLNTFLDAANRRLSAPGRLDFDERSNLVHKAADAVAALIAEAGNYYVPRERVLAVLNRLHAADGYERSLFRNLVAEGMFSESRWHIDSKVQEVVHFTYERFADHLLAKHLLDKYVTKGSPQKAFGPRTRLGRLLRSKAESWKYAGLKEALAVQLPERIGQELTDLIPELKKDSQLELAFVRSLVWRDAGAFQKPTFEYLESIWRFTHVHAEVLNALLSVAPVPEHPLNADKLHKILLDCTMANRDAWWSVFLSEEWGSNRAVNRLIDWAWEDSDKSAVSDQVALLTGTALAWFLTSSHRYLRDRTTKALVRLFDSRLRVLTQLLVRFRRVDDPYVSERLAAIAYGCALRAGTVDGLKELAGVVAEVVFGKHGFRPNLLTRDYGRGVIAFARHRGVIPPDAFPESNPPYGSGWPDMRIPSTKALEKWGKFKENATEGERAQQRIYLSTTDRHFSDFGKHLGDFADWTSVRVGQTPPQTSKDRYDDFLGRLSKRRRGLFDRYKDTFQGAARYRSYSAEERGRYYELDLTDEQLSQVVQITEDMCERSLAANQTLLEEFRTFVKPYVEHPDRYRVEFPFDGDTARRWLAQRVLDYGWTQERFGRFDAVVHRRYGRMSGRQIADSIGEKYLQFAYRELLARLADNFLLRKDRYASEELMVYRGPWDLGYSHGRDVDPSVVIRSTRYESSPTGPCWWSPVALPDWRKDRDDATWLRSNDDLPPVEPLLTVRPPGGSGLWYVLDTHVHWKRPARPGRKDYDSPHRSLYYFLRSYMVRKRDATSFFRWAKKQHFMGRWMPEPPDVYGVAHGEFYWAPEYLAWTSEWGTGWKGSNSDNLPNEILVTALEYVHESSGVDRSVDDSLRCRLPTQELAEGMGLSWSGHEGRFHDLSGMLAAIDPSVSEPGPGALVVRGDLLTKFLADQGLELFWILLGEKHFIGGGIGPGDLGWLEVDGVYRLTPKGIVGRMTTEHRKSARTRPSPGGKR